MAANASENEEVNDTTPTEVAEEAWPQVRDTDEMHEALMGLACITEAEAQYRSALEFFSRLPQRHRVLWNDGPRLQALE